jgi:hypothetical protein
LRTVLFVCLSACVLTAPACGKSAGPSPRIEAGSGGEAGGGGEPASPAMGGQPASAGVDSGGSGANEGGAGANEGGAGGLPAAPSLTLSSITISQTHELPLMRSGSAVRAPERPAPLIAGKRALVRAFVALDPGFQGRELVAVLDLKTPAATRTLVSRRALSQSSLQDDLSTTFVFNVDAADLSTSSTYRVRVLEADTTPIARFPDDGYEALEARALPAFSLVIVPFVIDGFSPKLGEAELLGLRSRLSALFPSMGVSLDVAPSVSLPYPVNAEGDGWDDALDHIYALRAAAAPAHDAFYFGAMAPAPSYSQYCGNSCVLGYSAVASETDVESRGSIGVTVFPDGSGTKDAWDTVAHELGHALGRDHAPCGISDPNDVDPDYPYANAGLGGIYGFDFDAMKLIRPKSARDVMSYCTPVWISDYTYRALFERLDIIASESFRVLAQAPSVPFRLARIRRTGETVWLGERYRRGNARAVPVMLLDAFGGVVGSVDAELVPLDHARGGYVWLPVNALGQRAAHSVDLRPFGGGVLPL